MSAWSAIMTPSAPYSDVPGRARSRSAISFCSMTTERLMCRACVDHAEEQRRGDLVRQVADDDEGPGRLLADGRIVERQGILGAHLDVAEAGQLALEHGDHVPVALDGDDAPARGGLGEPAGEGAEAGADLHDVLIAVAHRGRDDGAIDVLVDEEVLPPRLLRAKAILGEQRARVAHAGPGSGKLASALRFSVARSPLASLK
jgi:hypothetical protein